jgi:cholesterol transport system auxiliary component
MKVFSLLALLTLLTGCSPGDLLKPSGEPAKLYLLHAPAQLSTNAPQARWQLLIAAPDAPLDLDTARIAVSPAPDRIDYYANVSWSDRPPAMLQNLLLQSFDRSGHIGAVQRQSGGLKADFILTCDLQNFQVETSPEPVAHIGFTARLVRARDRTIIASRKFEVSSPAGGDFDGAIAAFDTGLQTILPQIVDWTLSQGAQNQ